MVSMFDVRFGAAVLGDRSGGRWPTKAEEVSASFSGSRGTVPSTATRLLPPVRPTSCKGNYRLRSHVRDRQVSAASAEPTVMVQVTVRESERRELRDSRKVRRFRRRVPRVLREEGGFTLPEMLVTMMIMLVVMFIAFSMMRPSV